MANDYHGRAGEYSTYFEEGAPWFSNQPPPRNRNEVSPVDRVRSAKVIRLVPATRELEWVSEQNDIDVAREFKRLRAVMDRKYAGAGLLTDRLLSWEYTSIIGLGPKVVPVILQSLEKKLYPWFHALRAITRDDPARGVSLGNFQAQADSWLSWGRAKNLI